MQKKTYTDFLIELLERRSPYVTGDRAKRDADTLLSARLQKLKQLAGELALKEARELFH